MDDFDRLLDELIQVAFSTGPLFGREKLAFVGTAYESAGSVYAEVHSLDDACGSHSLVGNS